jgi:tRNA-dihydrouridine synthase B
LKDPQKIGKIIDSLVRNLDIPVTAKIRLGWDENTRNYLEVAKIIQGNGASALFIHARTRKQEYGGEADWNAIGEVKNNLSIPIIGNGDVRTRPDINRLISQTGCDAVMIGRASIGNPWIFRKEGFTPNKIELYQMLEQHIDLTVDLYGMKVGVPIFRKHLLKYLADYLLTSQIRSEIFSITDPNQLKSYIIKLLGA